MRTPLRGALGALLVIAALGVASWSPTEATPLPAIAVADPDPLSSAVRGARTQVMEPDPAPMVCTPGTYVRRVNTGGKKQVALTFDDGPWPYNTAKVMDAIEARGGKATFFWIASNVQKYPDIARSVVARGHEVGNHSVSHQYKVQILIDEILPAEVIIRDITGVWPRLYRSPGLTASDRLQAALAYAGFCNIWANLLSGDASVPRPSSATICERFKRGLSPGTIVLLHDGGSHSTTVNAVPCMADWAVSHGYELVTVSDMMSNGYGVS